MEYAIWSFHEIVHFNEIRGKQNRWHISFAILFLGTNYNGIVLLF